MATAAAAAAAAVPTYHILGAGAMGCLVAAALARGGLPTTLLTRPPRQAATAASSVDPARARARRAAASIRVVETYAAAREEGAPAEEFGVSVGVEANDPSRQGQGLPPIARLLVGLEWKTGGWG